MEALRRQYAHVLNPDEGLWNSLKRVELGNVCCRDRTDLDVALRRGKERLRHKRQILKTRVKECGYSV